MSDLTQTAANVGVNDASTVIAPVQVGEAVTQGQPGYLNAADGKYYACDATSGTGSAAKAAAAGIFLTPAALDGYAAFAFSPGNVDLGATLTVGETYVLSGLTAKAIGPLSDLGTGDWVTILGIADAADNLVLDVQASGTQRA
jgi:hypothetical protein